MSQRLRKTSISRSAITGVVLAGLVTSSSCLLTAAADGALASTHLSTRAASPRDSFADRAFVFTLRAASITPSQWIPRELEENIGYSMVELIKESGNTGSCEAWGAAYWLGFEMEEAVIGGGFAPPDPDHPRPAGYKNPLYARDFYPSEPARLATPSVPAGPLGTDWTAKCNQDSEGHGAARSFDVAIPGGHVGAAGSTSDVTVDRATGVYTGTARGYMADVTMPNGTAKSIESLMQVKWAPGDKQPTVTYRISIFGASPGGAPSKVDQTNVTLGGTDVPMNQLVDQFNTAAHDNAQALASVARLGMTIMAPHVTVSPDGGRPGIAAPVVQMSAGFPARDGGIGQEQMIRFGESRFEGQY
jgi:hypothetical protein